MRFLGRNLGLRVQGLGIQGSGMKRTLDSGFSGEGLACAGLKFTVLSTAGHVVVPCWFWKKCSKAQS